ncbi:hypothetical protein JZ751_027471 [Albula glossodonta]|uniref:Eukaryotic translation initiation factor 3 subunit G N-terminal domain-containing protein n=1 Tax=Albula glossodonta TaxID=121402 RepID=A0A8T2NET1_9TELE|nr:hypothetical protein JZ751_027471 [Albula glossodonta]
MPSVEYDDSKPSWADQVEEEGDEGRLKRPKSSFSYTCCSDPKCIKYLQISTSYIYKVWWVNMSYKHSENGFVIPRQCRETELLLDWFSTVLARTLPSPKETIKGNIKTVTEYKIDEDGRKFKIVRTFKIETRKASKAVARRKNWKKFGNSEFDPPGPNVATTTVSDDVFMTFISSKEVSDDGVEMCVYILPRVCTCV